VEEEEEEEERAQEQEQGQEEQNFTQKQKQLTRWTLGGGGGRQNLPEVLPLISTAVSEVDSRTRRKNHWSTISIRLASLSTSLFCPSRSKRVINRLVSYLFTSSYHILLNLTRDTVASPLSVYLLYLVCGCCLFPSFSLDLHTHTYVFRSTAKFVLVPIPITALPLQRPLRNDLNGGTPPVECCTQVDSGGQRVECFALWRGVEEEEGLRAPARIGEVKTKEKDHQKGSSRERFLCRLVQSLSCLHVGGSFTYVGKACVRACVRV